MQTRIGLTNCGGGEGFRIPEDCTAPRFTNYRFVYKRSERGLDRGDDKKVRRLSACPRVYILFPNNVKPSGDGLNEGQNRFFRCSTATIIIRRLGHRRRRSKPNA